MTAADMAWKSLLIQLRPSPLDREIIERHRSGIEAAARQQRDAEIRAAVEGLYTHEAHAYEPGVEWLCVTSGDPPRSKDCGDERAHYRLIDRASVLALLSDHARADTPSREGGE